MANVAYYSRSSCLQCASGPSHDRTAAEVTEDMIEIPCRCAHHQCSPPPLTATTTHCSLRSMGPLTAASHHHRSRPALTTSAHHQCSSPVLTATTTHCSLRSMDGDVELLPSGLPIYCLVVLAWTSSHLVTHCSLFHPLLSLVRSKAWKASGFHAVPVPLRSSRAASSAEHRVCHSCRHSLRMRSLSARASSPLLCLGRTPRSSGDFVE